LRASAGHIDRIRTTSTRPDVAHSLLKGRSRAEIRAAVPALFSICARSQAAASELACAAAAGEALTADMLARCGSAVSAEMVRENAWRTLLEWPRWIAEPPSDGAIAAARASLQFRCDASADDRARGDAIANAVFGDSADEWSAMRSLPELERWTAAGRTAAARFIGSVLDDHTAARAKSVHAQADASADAGAQTQLLDGRNHAAWLAEVSRACDADARFACRPTWRGAPAETGALARQRSDPLIAELTRYSTTRVAARFVARLRELALLLTGRSPAGVGAQTLTSGCGVAWVDNARGLLIHQVLLDRQIARRYRIVAPTDWNFHPDGALASALIGAPARDLTEVKQQARRLVHSLDACMACRVEIEHA
jgi:hypothetical protein